MATDSGWLIMWWRLDDYVVVVVVDDVVGVVDDVVGMVDDVVEVVLGSFLA